MRGMEPEEAYSTAEAAKVLRISTRRVTQLLERGEREGAKDGALAATDRADYGFEPTARSSAVSR
jgi:hypothetical protein